MKQPRDLFVIACAADDVAVRLRKLGDALAEASVEGLDDNPGIRGCAVADLIDLQDDINLLIQRARA